MRWTIFACMLVFYFAIIIVACQPSSLPQAEAKAEVNTLVIPTEYDSLSAANYGADRYGMRKYVMAFLKKGPNRDLEPQQAAELQTAHLKNIERLAQEGKLSLAGPFLADGDLRGIYIFNVESIAEAEALTNTDPAIQSGSLEMELKEWYGSAALMAVNDIHQVIAQASVSGE